MIKNRKKLREWLSGAKISPEKKKLLNTVVVAMVILATLLFCSLALLPQAHP
jgi:hypothetical protein